MKDNNVHENGYSRSHIEDLLALYALGGLTQDEIQQVEAYVAQDAQAAAELADFMKTVEGLPFATAPITPSAQMEDLLMNRVEANAAARFPEQAVRTAPAPETAVQPARPQSVPSFPKMSGPTFWERLMGMFTQPAFSGGVMALAVLAFVWAAVLTQQLGRANQSTAALTQQVNTLSAQNSELNTAVADMTADVASLEDEVVNLAAANDGLANTNQTLTAEVETLTADNQTLNDQLVALDGNATTLQNQLASLTGDNQILSDQLADQQIVLDLFASSNTQTISLPGTEIRPEATGQMLIDPESNVALLVVSDLQPLEEGQVYQVLLIRDDGHDTADTFIVDAEGENVLLVNSTTPLSDFTAIGISIEPEGGSPQRTGDIIILGEL